MDANKTSLETKISHLVQVLLVAVIFCGCVEQTKTEPLNEVKDVQRGNIQILEVDSCEYVVWDWFDTGCIIHKQNCKFCAERSKK